MRETGGMGGGGGPTFNPIFLLGTFKGLVLGGGHFRTISKVRFIWKYSKKFRDKLDFNFNIFLRFGSFLISYRQKERWGYILNDK